MGKQDETKKRVKVSTQMDSKLLAELRAYAKKEGRQIQSVFEEAMEQYVDEKSKSKPNPDVMAIADSITKRYAKTLELLAK